MKVENKKNAFIIYNLGYGGAERVFKTLAENISNDKATFFVHSNKNNSSTLNLNQPNIKFYKNLIELYRLIKDYNIVYFSFLLAILTSTRYSFQSTKNIIRHAAFYERKLIPFQSNGSILKDLLLFILNNLSLRLIDKKCLHIAQNESMKNNISNVLGVDYDNIIVIPNPISDVFFTQKKINNFNKFTLLFVGRLIIQKGIFDLMDIIESLDIKIHLIIIGDGKLRNELEFWIKKNRKLININYIKAAENIEFYYANADITVSTSYEEGSPNVLLESLAVGTPVVAYDCNVGPSEIIIDGVNGFLVPLGDKSTFIQRIKDSINKKWNVETIKSSVTKHKVDYIVQKYLSVFDDES